MDPECPPCLLGRVLYEARLVGDDGHEAVRAGLKALADGYRHGVNSARLATEVHRLAYEAIGDDDPYAGLKRRATAIGLSLVPRAEAFINASDDRLEAAVRSAIAGNVMDFGIQGLDDPEEIVRTFDDLVRKDLAINDVRRIRGLLGPSRRAAYLFDNCGEDALDSLLIREIRATGTHVTGVVKGRPILTDVTREDAARSGSGSAPDALVDTGMYAIGLDADRMSSGLRCVMDSADVIISKGMANFESLSDGPFRPIAFLMKAKCRPVANAIGASKGDHVARLMA